MAEGGDQRTGLLQMEDSERSYWRNDRLSSRSIAAETPMLRPEGTLRAACLLLVVGVVSSAIYVLGVRDLAPTAYSRGAGPHLRFDSASTERKSEDGVDGVSGLSVVSVEGQERRRERLRREQQPPAPGPEEEEEGDDELDRPQQQQQSSPNPFQAALGFLGGMLQQTGVALHLVPVTTTTTSTFTTSTGTTTTTSTHTSTSTTFTTSTTSSTTTKLSTLFCFAVVRATGYEPVLMSSLETKKASIFDCEDTAVFSNGGALAINGVAIPEIEIDNIKKGNLSEVGTTTNSWLNTLIFMEAWEMVLKDGRWWNHDWTVKVDPDAVFFPQRLKVRLYPYYRAGDTNGPALYVANCDRSWNGQPYELKLFGSLEVFSRNAVGVYNAKKETCEDELDWEGWGEDFYMQQCMNMLSVGVINGVDFLADSSCYAAACWDTSKVAFHAFKDTAAWFSCWGESNVSRPTSIKRMQAKPPPR